MMHKSLRLNPAVHLRRPRDFERIYAAGHKTGDDHLLLFAFPNDLAFSRFGLSVSRRHGSAVRRNKKRRRLREAFRLSQHELPQAFDFVLVPRQRDDSTLSDYQQSLKTLASRLCQRLLKLRSGKPPEGND